MSLDPFETAFLKESHMIKQLCLALVLALGAVAVSTGCHADVDDDGAKVKVGD